MTIVDKAAMLLSHCVQRLKVELQRPIQVLGWYHSHPHITVWPSHVGRLSCEDHVTCRDKYDFLRCENPGQLSAA